MANFDKPYKFWKDDSFFTENWWLTDEKLVIAEQILYSEVQSNGSIEVMDLQINKEFNKLWTIHAGMDNTSGLYGEGWTGDALDTLANFKTRYDVPEEPDENHFVNQNIVDIETMQAIMDATATRFDLYNNHPLLGTLNEFFTYSGLAENFYRASVMLPVMYYAFKPDIAGTKTSPQQLGKLGEKAVGNIGPKVRINVNGRVRIPDGLTRTTLSEVKNVQSQSFTRQLRDFYNYANSSNLKFDLYVRPSTKLSGPLMQEIQNGNIFIHVIPGVQ